jgi:hypothetical protein
MDLAQSAFKAIPLELKASNQWVGWKLVMRDGPNPTKIPYRIRDPHRKSATDNPSTWASFPATVAIDRTLHQTLEDADRAAGFAGIGFVFTGTDLGGVDFDHVRDPQTGTVEQWAGDIIDALGSYTEISQSGTGMHVILRLSTPLVTVAQGGRYRAGRVEMYDATSPRFFAMTGNVDGLGIKAIKEVNLRSWQAKLPTLDPQATSLSRESAHDGDQSREDFHLACRLAREFNCAREKVAEEFRRQAVQRDKLKRKDYVWRTVEVAIRRVQQEKVSNCSANDWPEPEPLEGELPPVQPFDVELMPTSLRPLVEDTAERMQVPLDYPAVAAMLVLAGATNRRARIQPKAADTSWVVVPNLWGGIVAPPGFLKSPLITAMTRPLARLEALWRAQYESEMNGYEQQKEEAELRTSAWKEAYKAAIKGHNKDVPPRPDDSVSEPVCRRLITSDATVEKLHEILRDNPAGIFMIRDELSGWLASLDKPGREGERGFFLSAWNGDTPYTIDRIGRGSIYVPACCVSFLGGIQPARLRTYLSDALQDGPLNDGLLQRFQVLSYPDVSRDWQYVDRPPNVAAATGAQQLCSKLTSLDAEEPPLFRFDDDAQQLFIAWLGELEAKVRDDVLHPALASHLAKYRSLMPSLALLFELADGGTETVSLQHAQQAAAFCEYLESHARRVYSMIISPERHAAAEVGRHLKAGWKRDEGMFTVRDVYRSGWTGIDTAEKVRLPLEMLSDAGWIRPIESGGGPGRPSETYAINPRLSRRSK